MIAWIVSLQPVVIALVLAWTGVAKLRGFANPAQAERTVLARIVGKPRAQLGFRVVGAVELTVAAALLLPVARPAATLGAVVLSAGFLGYLWYGTRAAPDSDCGCSGATPQRVTGRGFARAGLLLALGLVSLAGVAGLFGIAPVAWWGTSLAQAPLAAAVLVLAELAVFGGISPEYDRYWLRPLRQLKVRLTHPLAATRRYADQVPLVATEQQLWASETYQAVGDSIVSDVLDSWDEGEWRILEYSARRDGRRTTAVFAVPLHRDDPDAVRVAFVDDVDEPTPAPTG